MLKQVVVLLALMYFSKAEETIKEILFHLRDLRNQQYLIIVLESPYYPGITIHWNVCRKIITHELLRALDHVQITSPDGGHTLQETVRKLQINIDGLVGGDQSESPLSIGEDCTKEKIMLVKTKSMSNSVFIDHYIRFFQNWLTNLS